MGSPRCIVVGIDTSLESLAAMEWALQLAEATGSAVIAVHAVGLLEAGGYREPPDLDAVVAPARARATVRSVAEPGSPAEALLRVAEREAADLVVVGSRGLGGTARQLGSTSDAVVREATLPVVVVPAPRLPLPSG
jgi:nucleotide-binding universal stress UspA family protein